MYVLVCEYIWYIAVKHLLLWDLNKIHSHILMLYISKLEHVLRNNNLNNIFLGVLVIKNHQKQSKIDRTVFGVKVK